MWEDREARDSLRTVASISAPRAGAAVALLAAVAYVETLGYELVWDDSTSVERWLPALRHWWSPFFLPPYIPQFPYNYYRPLQLISYQVDRFIGGGAPWPFHVTVVALHVAATVLVFRVALRLFGGPGLSAALWAAALFAVHPIHSESVAWMGARPDPMVACFGLTALLAYWRADWSERRRSWLAAALIFGALLSKENAAALLLLVPLSRVILTRSSAGGGQKRAGVRRETEPAFSSLLPFAVAGVAYGMLRFAGMPEASVPGVPAQPLRTFTGAVGTYLRLLLFPYPQNAYIADVPVDGAPFAVAALLVAAYGVALWLAWRWRPVAFSLMWLGITLVPSLAVINMPPTAPIAERYLYVPSIGFCWAFGAAVAFACERRGRARLAVQIAAGLLLAVALAATLNRNRVWRDNYSSWKDTTAKNPSHGLPIRNLAAATLQRGDMAEARRLLLEALERRNDPQGLHLIYTNLGTIALNSGDDAAAESYYRRALELSVRPDSLYNLGYLLLRRAIDPHKAPAAGARAQLLAQARDLLERALAMSPHDPDIYLALGHVAEAVGDSSEARRRFQQGLDLGLPQATAAAVRARLEKLN